MGDKVQKTAKELGLKTIFKYIFGALFLFLLIGFGIVTIKAGQVVIGILFFVLIIPTVIPHHILRITKSLKSAIIVVLLIALLAISGQNTPSKVQEYAYFKLGEKVALTFGENAFSIVIREVKQDTQLTMSKEAGPEERSTTGYFLTIKGDVTNETTEPVDFKLEKSPELKDGQDRVYTLYGESIITGKLQPGVAKKFTYVFEIPKDALELSFIIKDKTDIAKSIDLGR